MIRIVVDIGNTSIKAARFDSDKIGMVANGKSLEEVIAPLLSPAEKVYSAILSDVTGEGAHATQLEALLPGTRIIVLRGGLLLPIKNRYKTPQTLGTDRLANACGAWKFNAGKNSLVVDCGTCIKYDFVNAGGEYLGGSISPGLEMRFKALHKFTGKLPLISPADQFPTLTGSNTEGSIRSGVENGMLEEINGIARRYRELFDQTDIILTGGDHQRFAGKLKSPIFVAPNLTLNGLKAILDHNDQ